jgi:hypothetical protein
MKNLIRACLSGVVLATAFFVAPQRANAATVVLLPPFTQYALGINDLVVDGATYNVTFAFLSLPSAGDTTFAGNPAGALDAANAMIAALNGSTTVNITDGTFVDSDFAVQTSSSLGMGTLVDNHFATVGGWALNCDNCTISTGSPIPTAIFSETPLPAALPLFATGIGAMGLIGWRRKRKARANG